MKFTCTQENLAQALTVVSRVASKNVALPILHNVLLIAEPSGVKLQTTNLELAVTVTMRAKVEAPGRYTVPSRVLSDFVHLLGHEKVTIELVDGAVTISSGHSNTTLKGAPADDFPVLPTPEATSTFIVGANTLQNAINETLFSAANDESRPEISGLFIRLTERELIVAATDSYRLSERKITLANPVSAAAHTILPSRTAQELLRLLPKDDTEVKVSIGDNHLHCTLPETEIISRVIDGQYPDYQNIIPKNWETRATVSRDELIANIRAASLFCKPGINDIILAVDPEKKNITVSAANSQLGEHQSTVEAGIEGQAMSAIFNHRYFTDGLLSFSTANVVVDFTNDQAPALIHTEKQTEGVYLIMPIRQ